MKGRAAVEALAAIAGVLGLAAGAFQGHDSAGGLVRGDRAPVGLEDGRRGFRRRLLGHNSCLDGYLSLYGKVRGLGGLGLFLGRGRGHSADVHIDGGAVLFFLGPAEEEGKAGQVGPQEIEFHRYKGEEKKDRQLEQETHIS